VPRSSFDGRAQHPYSCSAIQGRHDVGCTFAACSSKTPRGLYPGANREERFHPRSTLVRTTVKGASLLFVICLFGNEVGFVYSWLVLNTGQRSTFLDSSPHSPLSACPSQPSLAPSSACPFSPSTSPDPLSTNSAYSQYYHYPFPHMSNLQILILPHKQDRSDHPALRAY